MAYYLIDYENVKKLDGIDNLTEKDTLAFFYSAKADTLSFSLHKVLMATDAKSEYYEIENGKKNALDFQLVTYAGILAERDSKESIYIISKDQGFLSAVSFLKEYKETKIELRSNITKDENERGETKGTKQEAAAKEKVSILDELCDAKSRLDINDDDCSAICDIVAQYKTKQAINNALMKRFRDSEKVGEITKVIKPFLKGKK